MWEWFGNCVGHLVTCVLVFTVYCIACTKLLYCFVHLRTPCSRVLLEKLTGSQLVKKSPTFYGTRRFITAFTSARHLSLSWASSMQSTPSHPTSWRPILILSSHLRLDLPNDLCLSGFPQHNPEYASPITHTRYMTSPSHSSRFHPRIIVPFMYIYSHLFCLYCVMATATDKTLNYTNNSNNNNNKRGFVGRNRALFNSNTGPSHTNKKLQEIYFESARHRRATQKMWKWIGDNPTHYCSMWATSSYWVCKETWWTVQNYPSESDRSSRTDWQ